MKKYVFMHSDAIPEGKSFDDITDEKIINMIRENNNGFWVYNSFEDFIFDFNNETAPNDNFCYGRVIDFPTPSKGNKKHTKKI